jgi:Na+-translocating ferredoxin:NAD+ oxidoreductase RnfG subunit
MAELTVLPSSETPAPKKPTAGSRWIPWLVKLYRAAVVIAIVWLVNDLRFHTRIAGDDPIRIEEAKQFFPTAAKLVPDPGEKLGYVVTDFAGATLGYVLKTSPQSDSITGYVGPTDTLVALDPNLVILGIRIRASQDTKSHVADVANDAKFMKLWNGRTFDDVAEHKDPLRQVTVPDPQDRTKFIKSFRRLEIEGVSGASLTSRAMATAIHQRFRSARDASAVPPPPVRFGWHDAALGGVILVGMAFAFTNLKSRRGARIVFQIVLVGYVGLINGQILSQSLLAGWTASSPPWRTSLALVLLAAVALVVPWVSRRQLYCSHLCPHGAAQEWAGRLSKRKLRIPKSLDRGLRWFPPLLIALVLFVTLFAVPYDLAAIEPFDAYVFFKAEWWKTGLTAVGWATVSIAVGGLILAAFVPMAYCKYGCPTGLVFSFLRSHGKADEFGRKELGAGLLVLFVLGMYLNQSAIHHRIYGDPIPFKSTSAYGGAPKQAE